MTAPLGVFEHKLYVGKPHPLFVGVGRSERSEPGAMRTPRRVHARGRVVVAGIEPHNFDEHRNALDTPIFLAVLALHMRALERDESRERLNRKQFRDAELSGDNPRFNRVSLDQWEPNGDFWQCNAVTHGGPSLY